MALTNAFYEAVSSGSIRRVRIMMKDSLLVDPTFTEFNEMQKEASKLNGLYDKYDGRPFNENRETWNDSYMNKLMVQVVGNFSHERIEHLKKVVRYLRPVSKKVTETHSSNIKNNRNYIPKKENKLSYKEQKRIDQKSGNYRPQMVIRGGIVGAATGAIVVSAVKLTAEITLSATVGTIIGATVIGMGAGGTIATFKTKERN